MRKGAFAVALGALLLGAILQKGSGHVATAPNPVASHKDFDCPTMTFMDDIHIPQEVVAVGQDLIIAYDKDCKVTNMLVSAKITPEGKQTVILPPGTLFGGINYRYSRSLPDALIPPTTGYEMAVYQRDKSKAPRTYTITIKEQ